jgi:hypothetical protein
MYRELKITLSLTILMAGCLLPTVASAQSYTGDFSTSTSLEEAQPDYSAPIPRVFSSNVSNVRLVEKLDVIYDNLFVSLWNYSSTDFIHQQNLSQLMEGQRFRTTRYSKEFTPVMNEALSDLNANYKSMFAEIKTANEQFETIMKGLKTGDQAVVEPLWKEKIAAFKQVANAYFKLQHDYLNTYRNLVGFVLKQGGSYYYKQQTRRVYFYKFGSYQYFGKSIDKMRMITYKQKQFLKEHAPANVDLLALQ